MRKTNTKKNRSRESVIVPRNTAGAIQTIYDKNGHMVCLNFTKHIMRQKDYKNTEYNKEMVRFIKNTMETQAKLQEQGGVNAG